MWGHGFQFIEAYPIHFRVFLVCVQVLYTVTKDFDESREIFENLIKQFEIHDDGLTQ